MLSGVTRPSYSASPVKRDVLYANLDRRLPGDLANVRLRQGNILCHDAMSGFLDLSSRLEERKPLSQSDKCVVLSAVLIEIA
jgi:hypothetical protein